MMGQRGQINKAGSVLLSHEAALAVSSGLEGLTNVFEMGTGVIPSALTTCHHCLRSIK